MNILITGLPGVGKTTLLKRISESLKDRRLWGFYTEEMREGGRRVGFSLCSFSGRRGLLAHESLKTPYRVGRYSVDLQGFEDLLREILPEKGTADVFLIDEIGKMECFSSLFVETVKGCLDSKTPFVATVAKKGGGFIKEVKQRRDVILIEMTMGNRDELLSDILGMLSETLSS